MGNSFHRRLAGFAKRFDRSLPLPIWSGGCDGSLNDDHGSLDKKGWVSRRIVSIGLWAFWKRIRLGSMKNQKQTNSLTRQVVKAGEPWYVIAETSAAATADLHPGDLEPASISLRKLLHSCTTAYRLCSERYRQRRQLLEMDDRQLKDIGITRELAEQEAGKPLWRG